MYVLLCSLDVCAQLLRYYQVTGPVDKQPPPPPDVRGSGSGPLDLPYLHAN